MHRESWRAGGAGGKPAGETAKRQRVLVVNGFDMARKLLSISRWKKPPANLSAGGVFVGRNVHLTACEWLLAERCRSASARLTASSSALDRVCCLMQV